MAVTEELVLEQLRSVIDPELFVNIVDLGLIYVVDLEEGEPLPVEAEGAQAEGAQAEGGIQGEASAEASSASPAASDSAESSEPVADNVGDAEADDADGGPVTHVKIDMTMTSPMCPAGPQLVANSKQAVGRIPGVGSVEVRVVMDPPWMPDRMTEDARDQLGIF